jgi:hypothetical protein
VDDACLGLETLRGGVDGDDDDAAGEPEEAK